MKKLLLITALITGLFASTQEKDLFIQLSTTDIKVEQDSKLDDGLTFYSFEHTKAIETKIDFTACIITAKNKKLENLMCTNKKGITYFSPIQGIVLDKQTVYIGVPLIKLKPIKTI